MLEQLGEASTALELALDTRSSSDPNVAKACSSRYWAKFIFKAPDTDFMALIWAAPPTRDTDSPTLMAGLIPA